MLRFQVYIWFGKQGRKRDYYKTERFGILDDLDGGVRC